MLLPLRKYWAKSIILFRKALCMSWGSLGYFLDLLGPHLEARGEGTSILINRPCFFRSLFLCLYLLTTGPIRLSFLRETLSLK